MAEMTTNLTGARDRKFYSIPQLESTSDETKHVDRRSPERLLSYVRESIIGQDKIFGGPFGLRKALYLDYTASGKSLSFIEDYIRNEVLPEYGNTHTTANVTSLQTTLFRHEARDIVRNAVHASEHDAVIFVGSGSTGAIHKLIHALNFAQSPVVFVGPYEHHSNLLPWKEIGAKVIRIREEKRGTVDLSDLEKQLKKWQSSGRQLIGCFSAASNITGILSDVDAINICLHKHGALTFWDYATAAPYIKVDMNPVATGERQAFVSKDAVFISSHKFVGGVGTPGILIAKKKLFKNSVPGGCGGGSVFFVRRGDYRYLQEPELKEEGGTPAIVESIRAGLVFQLKQAVTSDLILEKEHRLFEKAREGWMNHPSLIMLGNLDVERLPIFSFLVYHSASGRFLHYNYVNVLLNDLFGIQARGGCACAGPYAMDLLGMDEETSEKIEHLLAEDRRLDRTHLRRYREYSSREIMRPGFVRLNLPYFMDDESLEFVLEAVRLVAEEGWKLLPQYMFNPETGEWRQKNFQVFKDRKWLGHVNYNNGEMSYKVPPSVVKGPLPENYKDCIQKAKSLFEQASKTKYQLADHTLMFDEESKPFRYFLLPSEAAECLKGSFTQNVPQSLPFCPPSLRESLGLPEFIGNWSSEDSTVSSVDPENHINQTKNDASIEQELLPMESFAAGFENRFDQGYKQMASESLNSESLNSFENGEKYIQEGKEKEGKETQINDFRTGGSSNAKDAVGYEVRTEGPVEYHPRDSKHKEILTPVVCDSDRIENDTTAAKNETQSMSVDGGKGDSCSDCKSLPATEKEKSSVEGSNTICDNAAGQLGLSSSVDESTEPSLKGATKSCGKISGHQAASSGYSLERAVESSVTCRTTASCDRLTGEQNSSSLLSLEGAEEGKSGFVCPLTCTLRPGERKQVLDNCDINSESSFQTGPGSDRNTDSDSSRKRQLENGVGEVDAASKKKKDDNSDIRSKKKNKQSGSKWFSPPKVIFTPFLKAMEEHEMMRDGDRVLVCLSGGKDSLSLLHTIRQYQFYCRGKGIQFEFGAVTVDPQTPAYDPSPLKEYLASLGVPYFYESQCILDQAANLPYECASICSFCSRMKRGRIYACARREKYNVLALGQHLDDLCESFLMSFFHNGILRTMKAHYTVEEGDLRVIRPFVYVREKDLRSFAEKNKLPVIAENCPACFEAPKERHRMKQLLASQEILFPRMFNSMLSAMKPIMAISKTGVKIADIIQGNNDKNEEDDDMDI